jgi:Fe2+ or Zn2+ uptake regulation protein
MNTLQSKEILQRKEIKPSLHRLKILDYLVENCNSHPTVDMIYQDIHKEIPTLSKTTIYNTVKTFVENKIVRVITIDENEVRFDVKTNAHAHMKCIKCGSLYNVDVDPELFNRFFEENSKNRHKILETHIYFKGICDKCLNNSEP